MNDILRKSPIKRLYSSVSIAPHEMVVASADLNPSVYISDVPGGNFKYVDFIRTHPARAIRMYRGERTGRDKPYHAPDISSTSCPFIDTNTPEIIVQRISEAINDLRGTRGQGEKARDPGELQLVNYIKETSRSGRGQHRKQDKKNGAMKVMGLIVHLLIEESDSSSYIQGRRSNRIAIYRDIETLIGDEEISHKGITKTTFLEKVSRALLTVHDLD